MRSEPYHTTTVVSRLEKLYFSIMKRESELDHNVSKTPNGEYVVFGTIGHQKKQAKVVKATHRKLNRAVAKVIEKMESFSTNEGVTFPWLKLDVATSIREMSYESLTEEIAGTKKNYFRKGISFDAEFSIAFLEQEIQFNTMIREEQKNGPQRLNGTNISVYQTKNHPTKMSLPFIPSRYIGKNVYTFDTLSVFMEGDQVHTIQSGGLENGIREISNLPEHVDFLVTASTDFLGRQIQEDGSFIYGYFGAFGKVIHHYNILRHASTLYSMLEGYEWKKLHGHDDTELLKKIKLSIDHLLAYHIVRKELNGVRCAFVLERSAGNEIKLGANAAAILAGSKYTSLTGDHSLMPLLRELAAGIMHMQNQETGQFVHVLNYPKLDVKDAFRIIYYDGEATFALMRLYEIDRNEAWLDRVKLAFTYFIKKEYWRNRDHWLSYSANEMTKYVPDDRYFIFGLQNGLTKMQFMHDRHTTYPTFLELTMAAYKMIRKIKELGKESLLEGYDVAYLEKTIDRRVEYQRVGFFYPEFAMYTKYPERVLNSFFIRHHSFRVRIDDIEHNLSGYVQYGLYRMKDQLVSSS